MEGIGEMQAITEKRQSPGGCTGIFFHLFDWKRRLAKKHLLSSPYFLHPAREADRAANKLLHRSTSNTNKLLLIANENSGGFPELCPASDGMRAAGLVARLMGLESMPVARKINPKKKVDNSCNVDVPGRWPDSRPPKLQKTGGSMESMTARSNADALSKSVMLREKRHRHHKLPSLVKSPRTGASPARLMHAAATKILDSSRTTYALTYTESLQDNVGTFDAGSSVQCAREVPVTDFLAGSWMNYDRLDTREASVTCSEHSGSDYSSRDSSIDRKIKRPTTPSRRVRSTESFTSQEKYNVKSRVCDSSERRPWQNANSRHVVMNSQLRRTQSPLVRDREARVIRACSRKQSGEKYTELNVARNFITSTRNPKECYPTRSATKVPSNLRAETVRNGVEKNFDRKRRLTSGPQIENVAAFRKQAFVEAGLIRRKEAGFINNRPNNHHGSGRGLGKKAEGGSSSGCNDNGIVSFTFRSPVKQGSTSLTRQEIKEFRAHGKPSRDFCSKLKSDTTVDRVTLRGRALSNLLQQKIEQLTSFDEENLETVKRLPEKSTATILVELISALTTEAPAPLEKENSCSGRSTVSEKSFRDGDDQFVSTISQNQMLTLKEKLQEEEKTGSSASFLVSNSDRCSPVSILEASFSNDSCSMGSPCSSGSGGNSHHSSIETFGKRYASDFETNILDSETSTTTGELDSRMIPHSNDKEPGMFPCCLRNAGISEAKLNHVSKAMSNVQLMFESTSLDASKGTLATSVDTFLLSILESNIDAFRTNPKCRSGNAENQLRDLTFDCMIECFDSKCSFFCLSGYRAWLKLHAFLSRGQLLREVNEEIRGWGDFTGRDLDDLIVNEIWLSTSKQTQFEVEGFEMGIQIENELLDSLVAEMVTDICSC